MPKHFTTAIGSACAALLVAGWLPVQAQQAQRSTAALPSQQLEAFQERLADYVTLHKRVAGTVPRQQETSDPGAVAARERQLGDAIAAARKGAKIGDLFGAELSAHLVAVVRDDWKQRSEVDRRGLRGDMPAALKVQPNMRYPVELPILTAPARLLSKLPKLPEQLEYRQFGRHLVLRDTAANIIVDAVVDAFPPVGS